MEHAGGLGSERVRWNLADVRKDALHEGHIPLVGAGVGRKPFKPSWCTNRKVLIQQKGAIGDEVMFV